MDYYQRFIGPWSMAKEVRVWMMPSWVVFLLECVLRSLWSRMVNFLGGSGSCCSNAITKHVERNHPGTTRHNRCWDCSLVSSSQAISSASTPPSRRPSHGSPRAGPQTLPTSNDTRRRGVGCVSGCEWDQFCWTYGVMGTILMQSIQPNVIQSYQKEF